MTRLDLALGRFSVAEMAISWSKWFLNPPSRAQRESNPHRHPSLQGPWFNSHLMGYSPLRHSRSACIRSWRATLRPACFASSHRLNECWLSPDGRPMISPWTLRSSSKSGQWIPWPPPINSQFSLSCWVAWSSLGYQANGTEIVRPSASSAVRVSSVTATSSAFGSVGIAL